MAGEFCQRRDERGARCLLASEHSPHPCRFPLAEFPRAPRETVCDVPVRPLMGVPPASEPALDPARIREDGWRALVMDRLDRHDAFVRKAEGLLEAALIDAQVARGLAQAGALVREAARKHGMDADWVARLEVLCGLKEGERYCNRDGHRWAGARCTHCGADRAAEERRGGPAVAKAASHVYVFRCHHHPTGSEAGCATCTPTCWQCEGLLGFTDGCLTCEAKRREAMP